MDKQTISEADLNGLLAKSLLSVADGEFKTMDEAINHHVDEFKTKRVLEMLDKDPNWDWEEGFVGGDKAK